MNADERAARGALRAVLGGLARNGHLESVLELMSETDVDDVLAANARAEDEHRKRGER